ncbi:3-hydroxyacyl-CoA dehydrogenase NAD-binding domain-containing protein [Amycolatopsis sp. cg13]|uniref:3-hydroxyacyl-CoA dehydrogenase NAD-binding domain-containing protein n=1 Tax=Amycolatopsis sp. cg13 TaxID=3238807 RepID=UPI003524EAFD
MSERECIRWETGADGIVTLTMDDPGQSANTANEAFAESFRNAVDRLVSEKDSVSGVVVTSAKKTFFAGGDLNELLTFGPEDAERLFTRTEAAKADLRRLETLGVPVVAAINGAALGGGLEIALAAHHRIVADVPGTRIGLPEVTLGLLPGGGGVARTVRLLGVQRALTEVLLTGKQLAPRAAEELGLVDEVVETLEDLLPQAKAWIKANPGKQQPWDIKGYKIPGGAPNSPSLAAILPAMPATLRKQVKGANLPAPRAILAAAVEGALVDFDTASRVESRYFVELATGQVAKNIIQSTFFDLNHINSGGTRPEGYDRFVPGKVGVLGAGMMGAGIAYVLAKAGVEVVLKDVSAAAAEKGKSYAAKQLAKRVKAGKTGQAEADAVLARIKPAADPADLAGCDTVIEAVFEDLELKQALFAEAEEIVSPQALLASNTSSLPITELAESVRRPDDFIGLHFFSPVDKMPLVEIILGAKTSEKALAAAIDLTRLIKKTPIVVNDSRAFFTSRVISVRLNEAVDLVAEGVAPASIEQASLQAGYPTGTLQLFDEVTLTLSQRALAAMREAAGDEWVERPAYRVLDRMIDEFGRGGRSSGAGFYEYVDGARAGLWPGLRGLAETEAVVPFEDIRDRLLFAEVLESVRCFDKGVLRSVPEANVGSLLGIGFPGWTGGVVQFIDGYPSGVEGFVARANELADRYGERFRPTVSLIEIAGRGETARKGLVSA